MRRYQAGQTWECKLGSGRGGARVGDAQYQMQLQEPVAGAIQPGGSVSELVARKSKGAQEEASRFTPT